jgi:DNA-binding PadR family transcriptional regulator
VVEVPLTHPGEGVDSEHTDDPEFPTATRQGPRELVCPFALLLIGEAPAHGYALAARLKDLGFDWGGAGSVYTPLRDLHRRGFVESSLTAGAFGPVRRTYMLTASGRDALDAYADGISGMRRGVVRLLSASDAPLGQGTERSANFPFGDRQGAALLANRRPAQCDLGTSDIIYPREMILAGILIVLARNAADAAEIVDALTNLGIDCARISGMPVYLNLLAATCLIYRAQSGPICRRATKLYELSPAGRLAMPAWLAYLESLYSLLRRWSDGYARLST